MWHRRLALIAAACAMVAAAAAQQGKVAPGFRLTDMNGATVDLSQYRGKVVLLNFWATTCGGCKVEIPWFMEFESKYKSAGLAVIGVSLDQDGVKVVRPFVAAKKMNYTVAVGGDRVARSYGVEAMPATFLIGRDGKVAWSVMGGLVDRSKCAARIRALLGGK